MRPEPSSAGGQSRPARSGGRRRDPPARGRLRPQPPPDREPPHPHTGRQLPHRGAAALEVDSDGDLAGAAPLGGRSSDPSLPRQRERRAERRVPSEGQLHLRREDPDVVSVGANGRHEGGLGEADLHARATASSRRRVHRELPARRRAGCRRTATPRTRRPAGTGRSWAAAYRPSMLIDQRGCSSMAEFQPSKLAMRVRFPSPALHAAGSSARTEQRDF